VTFDDLPHLIQHRPLTYAAADRDDDGPIITIISVSSSSTPATVVGSIRPENGDAAVSIGRRRRSIPVPRQLAGRQRRTTVAAAFAGRRLHWLRGQRRNIASSCHLSSSWGILFYSRLRLEADTTSIFPGPLYVHLAGRWRRRRSRDHNDR